MTDYQVPGVRWYPVPGGLLFFLIANYETHLETQGETQLETQGETQHESILLIRKKKSDAS